MDDKFLADKDSGGSFSSDSDDNLSFWDRLLSFFRDESPEGKKRKLLRDIRKNLKKQKFKFINVKTEEALPALARFY